MMVNLDILENVIRYTVEYDIQEGLLKKATDKIFKDAKKTIEGYTVAGEKLYKLFSITKTTMENSIKFAELLQKEGKTKPPKPIKPKSKKDKEEIIVFTGLLVTENFIAEQIIFKNGVDKPEPYFAKYMFNTKTIHYETEIEHEGTFYKPILDEEVQEGYIKLPTRPEKYGTVKKLDKELHDHIYKWLDIPETHIKYAIYNIRKSWVYDKFHSLNYLRALGDTGTGKSRYLDTLGYLHYKPIATSGALTSAVLFRVINKWRGTLVIDEADQKKSDETEDLIKIINQGYEKGRPVMRCDKENKNKLEFFNTYGPKIIATRRAFTDKATESRCMTQVMRQTPRKDIIVNLNEDFFREQEVLRNKLLMWRFDNYNKIEPNAGEKIDLGNIEPRLRQVNIGFVSMFVDDKEEIERFREYLKDYQKELIETRSDTIEGLLINSISNLILEAETNKKIYITPEMIVEESDLKDKSGTAWKPRRISKYMKSLGFENAKPKKVEIDLQNIYDKKTLRFYDFDKTFIQGLIKKYVFDEELLENLNNLGYEVTKVTAVTHTGENNNKEQKVTELGCIQYSRNLRNLVTLEPPKNKEKFDVSVEELDLQIFDIMKSFPKDNANLLDEYFDERLKVLIKNGDIMETPKGTYKKV